MTKPVIGLAASAILLLIGTIHLYWAIKGSMDLVAVIPEKEGRSRLTSSWRVSSLPSKRMG